MEEYFWNPESAVTTNRYFVIDAVTGQVTRLAQSIQAYTREAYTALLTKCGYTNLNFFPSLTGGPDPEQSALFALLATNALNDACGLTNPRRASKEEIIQIYRNAM